MRASPTSQEVLAIDGGTPVRKTMLPYGRQSLSEDDIQTVVDVLRSDWLTAGPKVAEFEEALAAQVGAKYAVAYSSGTAALHGAAFAAGLKPGDEAITSPLTFAATANCVLYQGARPVFADVSPDTILALGERHGLTVIEDACHALGADYKGRRTGSIAHMAVFSFHPVKHVATGEGGMVTTDRADLAENLRR